MVVVLLVGVWLGGHPGTLPSPLRGAFFICAPYKVQEQQAVIVRAFAFTQLGAAAVQASPPLQL